MNCFYLGQKHHAIQLGIGAEFCAIKNSVGKISLENLQRDLHSFLKAVFDLPMTHQRALKFKLITGSKLLDDLLDAGSLA